MTINDVLDPDKIALNLRTSRIGRKILVYNSTTSTNDVAAEYARNRKNDGLVIFAEYQTAGRGRAGAEWVSRPGDSILASILLTECVLNCELLSLACGIAVAEAVTEVAGVQAKVKWPNDVLVNGRKAAGILVEAKSAPQTQGGICIVGVGINCHQTQDSFDTSLQAVATSIDMESHCVCNRNLVAKMFLVSMDNWLAAAQQSPEAVTEGWSRLSAQMGQHLTVVYNGAQFSGICAGIDPEKGLTLRLDSGGVRFFDAVHTTIVK
ncbi:MAG TPA: biotin--[acetyl-CoA-carboxylase] ligase [Sedimentisphaerales bacterium]|nr:biotin--[acetyl-CoA-carboxylase] ligase [Sedimentisphaerales bacterium]